MQGGLELIISANHYVYQFGRAGIKKSFTKIASRQCKCPASGVCLLKTNVLYIFPSATCGLNDEQLQIQQLATDFASKVGTIKGIGLHILAISTIHNVRFYVLLG